MPFICYQGYPWLSRLGKSAEGSNDFLLIILLHWIRRLFDCCGSDLIARFGPCNLICWWLDFESTPRISQETWALGFTVTLWMRTFSQSWRRTHVRWLHHFAKQSLVAIAKQIAPGELYMYYFASPICEPPQLEMPKRSIANLWIPWQRKRMKQCHVVPNSRCAISLGLMFCRRSTC